MRVYLYPFMNDVIFISINLYTTPYLTYHIQKSKQLQKPAHIYNYMYIHTSPQDLKVLLQHVLTISLANGM
jgi:hypothetical protein